MLLPYRTWFESGRGRFRLKHFHDRATSDIADILSSDIRTRASRIWPAKIRTIADHEDLPQTTMHGDVHLGNWYITGSGDVGPCDWRCPTAGTYGQDLAYAITSSLRIEDRRAWERDLVGIYVPHFNSRSPQPISVEDCWRPYRRHALAGLMMWPVTLVPHSLMPDMQPREASLEILRRTSTAMPDLATLDLA